MVRTGDQADDKVSRHMAPCDHTTLALVLGGREGVVLTVWLLTLGCHTFVSNFIIGGLKGYSPGILTSIVYVPPSYGVPGGPLKEPLRCVRSSPLPAGFADMLETESWCRSAISFAIRRLRLLAILKSCQVRVRVCV